MANEKMAKTKHEDAVDKIKEDKHFKTGFLAGYITAKMEDSKAPFATMLAIIRAAFEPLTKKQRGAGG